jgi:hypothetical protein
VKLNLNNFNVFTVLMYSPAILKFQPLPQMHLTTPSVYAGAIAEEGSCSAGASLLLALQHQVA